MSATCSVRRKFIQGLCGFAVIAPFTSKVKASPSLGTERVDTKSLALYNRHTSERHQACFLLDGQYQMSAIKELDNVLRDHRQNIVAPMDKRLYSLLHDLQTTLDYSGEIHVISGYRSPKTNALLAGKSSGVAKKSYHMRGMAIDIAMPGIELAKLRDAAIGLKQGGVGYYPKSGFIHVDVGRVRRW